MPTKPACRWLRACRTIHEQTLRPVKAVHHLEFLRDKAVPRQALPDKAVRHQELLRDKAVHHEEARRVVHRRHG
jgi:hypothetical protein